MKTCYSNNLETHSRLLSKKTEQNTFQKHLKTLMTIFCHNSKVKKTVFKTTQRNLFSNSLRQKEKKCGYFEKVLTALCFIHLKGLARI